MTQKKVLTTIRRMGLTCGRTHYGEYRVNLPRPIGTEATAYYTNDGEDAIATAHWMLAHANLLRNPRGL